MKLSNMCYFVSDKVKVSELNRSTYISTENMYQNRGGITLAASLPTIQKTNAFAKFDILVSNIRPYFKKIWKATNAGGCSNDILVFRAATGTNPAFLYYVLADDKFFDYATSTSKGTKMPRGDKVAIMEYEVPNRTPEHQRKIAAVLSALDDKIELNTRINKNLEEQSQALFKSWFIDFEPFGGTIPGDWERGCLLDIARYLNGLSMQKFRPTPSEENIPVLKIKELRQGFCDSNSDLCSANIDSSYIVEDGDVIFSWSGSLLVDIWCGGRAGLNQHLFKVSSNKYDKWFYYSWTKYHLNHFISVAVDKATTMGHIKRNELEKAEVIIPSSIYLQKIGQIIAPIYDLIIQNRIENSRLALIRNTLLPMLMSGEIDVSKVDISDLGCVDKLSVSEGME